jgi:hypothetical protein
VSPIVFSGSIPAFQQDWTWPLSRALALQWLSTFAGLWDGRGLGGANTLAWQAFVVLVQACCAAVLGPSLGLALWLAATFATAAAGCVAMVAAFGVRSWIARLSAAVFYAFGPVTFTREAAGHLAYLVGYALLPLVIALAFKVSTQRGFARSVTLGIVVGFAASQVQFYAIAWLAIAALIPFVPAARGWPGRLGIALAVSLAVQLQSLLPLLVSAVPAAYLSQRALLSWELNNSSPVAGAGVMLGYFTHYYETHALPATDIVLYAVLAAGLFGSIVAARRLGIYPLALCALGFAFVSGLYGPLAGPLSSAFERYAAFTALRDLHYFAALTAAGMALAIGFVAGMRPIWFGPPALAAALWIAAPGIGGRAVADILVPRAYVADALHDMRTVASHGPGRVLMLPAEEPLGPIGASNQGRDFETYGLPGNPSVSDDYQNPELSYALSAWRSGRPDWSSLARMDVRYVVFRKYLRSDRQQNFGTGVPMGFAGISDGALGASLEREPRLLRIERSSLSSVYEIRGAAAPEFVAPVRAGAMRFSELGANEVAVAGPGQRALDVAPSAVTADPRSGWVGGTLGWRYLPWMPDSVYPFVWTVSSGPLQIDAPAGTHCVLAAATEGGVAQPGAVAITGAWARYPVKAGRLTLQTHGRGVGALADVSCDPQPAAPGQVLAVSAGYDRGWRVMRGGALEAPWLADGWMMAWPAADAGLPRVYLPALAQLIGLLLGTISIVLAFVWARRADRIVS